MAGIELKSLRKSFQGLEVIRDIDLTVEDGAFTVLVGPSGCGKSTLLRMMAGLENVTSGEVHIDGRRCDHLLPSARGMAMVFQSYALYPHMSVEQNLRFGLENIRTAKDVVRTRVAAAAEILQITHLLQRRPHQLSGGQSQRVAIGRAIVKEPKAFLFDEPLSNLDAELRGKMRGELIALHRRLGATMVYVTHDQVEAMTMADKIVVLRDGRIEQAGSPLELYARPQNQFVAGFLGAPQMNMLQGTVVANDEGVAVALPGNLRVALSARMRAVNVGAPCVVGIRPEHMRIGRGGTLVAKVETTEILGADTIIHARLPAGQPITVSLRGISALSQGADVAIGFDDRFAHVFDEQGQVLQPMRDWRDDYIA